jgi:outer membrane protein TolC
MMVAATLPAGAKEGGSLGLPDAIASALRRDERALSADVQLQITSRQTTRANEIFGPRITGSANMFIQQEINIPGIGLVQDNLAYQVGGQLVQQLYVHEFWGRRRQA